MSFLKKSAKRYRPDTNRHTYGFFQLEKSAYNFTKINAVSQLLEVDEANSVKLSDFLRLKWPLSLWEIAMRQTISIQNPLPMLCTNIPCKQCKLEIASAFWWGWILVQFCWTNLDLSKFEAVRSITKYQNTRFFCYLHYTFYHFLFISHCGSKEM